MKKMIMMSVIALVVVVVGTSVFAADGTSQGRLPSHRIKAHAMYQQKGDPSTALPLSDVNVVVVTKEGTQWLDKTGAYGHANVDIETEYKEVEWYATHKKKGKLEGSLQLEDDYDSPLTLIFETQ